MKAFIAALAVTVAIGIPTMLGFIPTILGVPAIIGIVLIKDIIFLALARGLPMAMMSIRAMGGLLWGVMDKTNNITTGKKKTKGGMVFTKSCGAYNAVSEAMVRLDGVPLCVAPEEVGYNVKLEHLQLIKELKDRGISNILEVIDTNEQGQFTGWKDDKRIRDLKKKYTTFPQLINLPGLNDYHRYAIEAAHPFRQDANVKIGIAQGTPAGAESSAWKWIAALAIIGVIVMGIFFLLMGGGTQEVKVITENAPHVIPA